MKIALYDDSGNEKDSIDAPEELAEEMMAAARRVLHSRRR